MSDRWIRDADGNIVGKASTTPEVPEDVDPDEDVEEKAVRPGEAEDKAVSRAGTFRKRV